MQSIHVLAALTIMASFATSRAQNAPQTDEAAPRAICLSSNKDFHKRNPSVALPLLISELKPVARGHYLTGEHPYAVWCIRALRAITRKDFTASTNAKLTHEEKRWLRLDNQNHVVFFGTWMSRDSLWVAPVDAQVKIIAQWREWFKKEGQNQKFVYDDDFDHWYF